MRLLIAGTKFRKEIKCFFKATTNHRATLYKTDRGIAP